MDELTAASWGLVATAPGTVAGPGQLPEPSATLFGRAIPARVPGTVAEAVRDALGADVLARTDLDAHDWWYAGTVDAAGAGLLIADGLATVADVWVDGEHVLHGESMFRRHVVELPRRSGSVELAIRFAAPLAFLGRRPRPRWKTALVADQRWRWLRTAVLGRVASQIGTVPVVGPSREFRVLPAREPVLRRHRISTWVDGADGVIMVEADALAVDAPMTVAVGGQVASLERPGAGRARVELRIPDVDLWWPHTHGAQPRYELVLSAGDTELLRTHVGFRTVKVERTGGAFALQVNGAPVFARGAVWTPLDVVTLRATRDELRAALGKLRDGGHNLVRIPGIGVYESDTFHDVCDELGMLVWQDCMITALDYPQTEEFTAELRAEIEQLADGLARHPSTCVVCGGAETEQQPAMLGLGPQEIPAITDTVPTVLAERLPGVPYVASTPTGGHQPMTTGTGVAQYFGVGAYLRPLLDVRAAGVRFAGESLAFSIPPEQHAVLAAFGSSRVAGHDPRWKAAVPRDASAAWDFEDVRDHYVRSLFGVEPLAVRYDDPDRYLDLGRAAVCVAMSEVFGWWRRARSGCGGGIVLTARDAVPGAGWGLLDDAGRAKAPWFALRRALAPLAVLVADDAADGVTITVVNDRSVPVTGELTVEVFGTTGVLIDTAASPIEVAAHGSHEVALDAVLGRFTDAGHYYRFGPRVRDLVRVRVVAPDGTELLSCTEQLGHHLRAAVGTELSAVASRSDDDGWTLRVTAAGPAHWVAIDSRTHEPADSWFHLAPGEARDVRLTPVGEPAGMPRVTVRALDVAELAARVDDGDPTRVDRSNE